MNPETLKNQIWTTRISRVNAERRLLMKEDFIQGINIYYSCILTIFSILSLVKPDNSSQLSLISTYMSVCLLIAILYTNSLRYREHARDYRTNYTALQKLEFRLNKPSITFDEMEAINDEYCTLLDGAANHIQFDYYCTVAQSRGQYRTDRWKGLVKVKYYWGVSWRVAIMLSIIAFPVGVYIMCGVF